MNLKELETEFEATFTDINPNLIREKIKSLGGKLIKPQFNQKRTTFNFPKGNEIEGGFLRVRDESDKITMTLKIIKSQNSIDSQKEVELKIDDYENAVLFLKTIGAKEKAFQETKRELWKVNNVEIMIDWWPFLEPIIEIEGKNEKEVKELSQKLGFNWENAIFDSIDYIYSKKYNISRDIINNKTPKICFDIQNPFI